MRARAILFAAVCAVAAGAALAVRATRPGSPPPPPPPPAPAPARTWPTPFSVSVHDLPSPADLPPGTMRVLVLGDSEASFLGLALRYRQDEASAFVAERGVGECSIFAQGTRAVDADPPVTTSCSSAWVEDVAALRPDVTLIVMGGAFLNARACEEAWLSRYQARLLDLLHRMGDRAGRVVIARVPYPMGRWRYSNMLQRVDCFDAMLDRTAAEAHAEVLDLMGHVCPTPACVAESHGQPVRPDGLHFDGVGAEETARWTLGELRRPLGVPHERP